jgi:Uma2 family endonuclease
MAVALKPPPAPVKVKRHVMTLAEFNALPEGPPDFELDEGELIAMPRPHARHKRTIMRLSAVLDNHVTTNALGVVWPEVDVQLSASRVYAPDIVFVSAEHQDRYSATLGRVVGAPDLVVEIVSPSSAGRDRVVKFNAYRQAGVEWYWLVDSESLAIEEYHLTSAGYLAVARVALGEVFAPQIFPGLEIDLAALLGAEIAAEPEISEL